MVYRVLGFLSISLLISFCLDAQTNMHFTSSDLTTVFAGSYNPSDFPMYTDFGTPEDLVSEIETRISPDSLKATLLAMQQFQTRNTGSDTVSQTRGIGAARNWVLDEFNRFSAMHENRLITGFFEFDQVVCGISHHKNVVAMLPGTHPEHGVIIIEAHLDSRCESVCDTACLAQGMDDNGSGSALVIELARVLSAYNYPTTLVFMTTTGEEQGLIGATALAEYASQQDVNIRLVQNNDIVGGIICGETSSPPSCPGLNDIDSTQVRLFSYGGFNSTSKGICRYIKMQYEDMLKPIAKVPMQLTLMTAEDRTGRGGDHIPFREKGYPAMRFTSANENGDASNGPDYHDRQHTSRDILGVDTDGDMVLDSFFVDFDYLSRNCAINATGALMAAIAPDAPWISTVYFDRRNFYIELESDIDYPQYKIGVRTDYNDFDSVYVINGGKSGYFQTQQNEFAILISVMSVDSNDIESIPFEETRVQFTATDDLVKQQKKVYMLQNKPNPFDESTMISYWVESPLDYHHAEIIISDMEGKVVRHLKTTPKEGMNEVLYEHGYNASGTFIYALVIDGRVVDQKPMVFAN